MGEVLVAVWHPGRAFEEKSFLERLIPIANLFGDTPDVGHAAMNIDGMHVSLWPQDQVAFGTLDQWVKGRFAEDLAEDLDAMGKEYHECYVFDNLDTDLMARQARLLLSDGRFHVLRRNCSTVVGRILLKGLDVYVEGSSFWKRLSYSTALDDILLLRSFDEEEIAWTPALVRKVAQCVMKVAGGRCE